MSLSQRLGDFVHRHPKLSYFGVYLVFFFPLYVVINQAEARGHVWGHSLKTPFDTMIPYWPGFIFIYASLLSLMAVPFLYIRHPVAFQKYTVAVSCVALTSGIIFLVFPTYDVLRPLPDFSDLSRFFLTEDDAHDAPYNCFPSLHVGSAVTVLLWVRRFDRTWFGNLIAIWAALVAVSVLFVKEHYIADVFGGAVIASVFYRVFSRRIAERVLPGDPVLNSRRWLLLPLAAYLIQTGIVVMKYWKQTA